MPEYMQKTQNGIPTGDTDWSKLFMGFAMAFVFVLQAWHGMQVQDLKANVVPRAEFESKHSQLMQRDEILAALKALNDRMDANDAKR